MSKLKTPEELIKAFNKANKVRRAVIANNAGLDTPEEYLANLEKKRNKVAGSATTSKPKIHVVHILDASTSMGSGTGSKFEAALQGIRSEVERLKTDTEADYHFSLEAFSSFAHIDTVVTKTSIKDVVLPKSVYDRIGATALYDAIGKTLTKLKNYITPGENVLVSIFTDGGENDSRNFTNSTVTYLIKECEKLGFTITFIGTDSDVKEVTRRLSIHESNTLVHDNTSAGVSRSFQTKAAATMAYSAAVAQGEDVTTGFYKRIIQ